MAYIVEFAESVRKQIRVFPANQRTLIITTIGEQLVYEPLIETRNRKPMRPNLLAAWELRIGDIRVFYDVVPEKDAESDEQGIVRILAVGRKEGNKLLIRGEEIKL